MGGQLGVSGLDFAVSGADGFAAAPFFACLDLGGMAVVSLWVGSGSSVFLGRVCFLVVDFSIGKVGQDVWLLAPIASLFLPVER